MKALLAIIAIILAAILYVVYESSLEWCPKQISEMNISELEQFNNTGGRIVAKKRGWC